MLPREREEQASEKVAQSVNETSRSVTTGQSQSLENSMDHSKFSYLRPAKHADELGWLGPYRILSILGQGGMGTLFRAEDPALNRKVALKTMQPQFATNEKAKLRFLREARAQAAVEHDHIIPIYQVGEDNGVPFIAMPLLKGQTLADALKANPKPPLGEVLRIGREIAEGLGAAHAVGLKHRDIKPANIWLEGTRRRVKILDFGLARADGESQPKESALTIEGAIIGTPSFMSPQQGAGEPTDHRTDLFSLGVVLYLLCTGELPFSGRTTMAILIALATEQPLPVRTKNPAVPVQLDDLIQRLLVKDPQQRLQSAAQVVEELTRIEQELAGTLPAVTAMTSAEEANPWADIDVTELEDSRDQSTVKAEAKPNSESPKSQFGLMMAALALGVVLLIGAGGFIIIKIKNKGGTVTELKVPDGSKIEVTQGGKTMVVSGGKNTSPNPGTLLPPSTYTWKPIPVGESPFDKLDPNAIPKEERFDWQPKELVGLIGSHARRQWWPQYQDGVALSPDGSLAATAGREIIIWDTKTQTPKAVLPPNQFFNDGYIRTVQFLPDGKSLFCKDNKSIELWDLSGTEPKMIPFGTSDKPAVIPLQRFNWLTAVLVEEGQTAVTLVTEGNSAVAKLRTFNLRGPKLEPGEKGIEVRPGDGNIAIAASANRVVYVTKGHKLRQLSIKNGHFDTDTELPIPLGPKAWVKAITPDGNKLVVRADKQVQVWDLSAEPPRVVHRIPALDGVREGSLYVVSPDGKWLTVKYNWTALFRLDAEEPKRLAWLDQTEGDGPSGGIAFSVDSIRVVLGNYNGLIRFWDLSGGEPKEMTPFDPSTAFPVPNWMQTTTLESQLGRVLLPRDVDPQKGKWNRYQMWDLSRTGPVPGAFLDPPVAGPVHSLGQDRFVQMATSYDLVSHIYRWNKTQFDRISEPFGSPNTLGNVSPDGRTMVVYSPTSNPKQLEGWDLSTDTPKQKWTLAPKDQVLLGGNAGCKVWFSADNRWLATQAKGEKDGGPWKLVLWRRTGAKPEVHAMLSIEWQAGHYRAAFSPDGRYLAHTTKEAEITLLDLSGKQPREIARFQDATKVTGYPAYLVFHPDGKKLAVASWRGVCILDAATATMKPVWNWQSPGPMHWLDWAADGRHLVTHNGNMTVYVLRLNQFGGTAKAAANADR